MYIPRHAQPAPNAILHQPPRQPAYLPARRPREKEKKRKEKKRKEKKRHSTTQQPAGRGRQRHRHRHRQRRPACICVCICICICTSYRTSSTPRRRARRRKTRPNYPTHPCQPPVLASPRRTGCWPDRARGVHADRQTCSFVATAGRSVGFAGCALFSSALPWKCETCFWLAPELFQACLRRSWRDARCSLACRKLG
jgi:hypothetical protein